MLLTIPIIFLVALVGFTNAAPRNLPEGWQNEDMIRNLGITTDFVFLPDERMLVTLKAGRILVIKGKKVTNIALDLNNKLGPHYGDRGLMSIEVDPDFERGKPYVYLAYVWDASREVIGHLFGKYNSTWPRGAEGIQGTHSNYSTNHLKRPSHKQSITVHND
jgi:glucose/arabinose dehydrogenase